MKRIPYATGFGLLFLATASAFAAEGYVTRSVSLRAGPDASYPSVARLHAGEVVAVEGCVDGWSWCDVSSREDRGWINGDYLEQEYEGHRVLVPAYGVQIGIPVISFVFGSYWDDHYRHRSWYGNRDHWSHVRPQYRSSYGHTDAHANSYDRTHYGAHGDSHQSNTTVYQGTHSSSQPGNVVSHHDYQQRPAGVTTQSEVRQARTVENGSGHSTHVQHDAPRDSANRHDVTRPIAEHNGSANESRHADHGANQPRTIAEHSAVADRPTQHAAHGTEQHTVIAEHKAKSTDAAPRAAHDNPAHDRNGHDQGKGNSKDDGKDNGKDKEQN
jgi:uncharacterized protein YraI